MSSTTIEQLKKDYEQSIQDLSSLEEIENQKKRFLGKQGLIKTAFGDAKSLEGTDKIQYLKDLNALKDTVEKGFQSLGEKIQRAKLQEKLDQQWQDLRLPGVELVQGSRHPLSEVESHCIKILSQIGFDFVDGPEVEDAFHNFDALNIPEHHPARDMQDTFWLDNDLLLRSHTSTVQVRVMEKFKGELPIRIVSPGRVYRNEAVDATHLAFFHQFEGLYVDRGVTFPEFKGTLAYLVEQLFDPKDWDIRFKPKFYPYTEPSIGVDVAPKGPGKKRWITILGAGMVHPNVFKAVGMDPNEVNGFAFGLGISRIVAQMHGVRSMKSLYDPDLRVHKAIAKKQFN